MNSETQFREMHHGVRCEIVIFFFCRVVEYLVAKIQIPLILNVYGFLYNKGI